MENTRQITTSIDDILFKEDFVKHFEVIVKYVKEMKEKNDEDMEAMKNKMDEMTAIMKEEAGDSVSESKQEMMDYCMAEMEKMMSEHKQKMQDADDKMDLILDGKDADEERVISEVISKVQEPIAENITKSLPALGSQVRDSLELLADDNRLDISAVKGAVGIHIGAEAPEDKTKLWIEV